MASTSTKIRRISQRVEVRRRVRPSIFLESVSISELFGRIDYPKIRVNALGINSNMNIIFGDNGTGKTTILKLIYACLSAEGSSGLRTRISQTPFRKFSIRFANKTEIVVQKTKGLIGPYIFSINTSSTNRQSFEISADDEGNVPNQPSIREMETRLSP